MRTFDGRWMIGDRPDSFDCDACTRRAPYLIGLAAEPEPGWEPALVCPACARLWTGQTHLRTHGETADGPQVVTFDLRAGTYEIAVCPPPSCPS